MGKTISVEPQQLKDTAKKIDTYATTFEEIYKKLLMQAETMGEAYQGDDNLAYVERIKGLSTKLNQMTEKLKQSSTALKTQAQNYEDRRADNIAKANSLAN